MSPSLLKLQLEWYAKLRESGFKDVEDRHGNLKQHNIRTIAYRNQDVIRDFFTDLGEYLSSEVLSELHLTILSDYVEGMHIKKIAIHVKKSERTVRTIIGQHRDRVLRGSSS